jgi:UDP-2,3-diacylglucosamine hydrolase
VAAAARRVGRRVVTVAIREETDPGLESEVAEIHWVSLGQLGKALQALHTAGVREAIMAGQVKHRQIFSDVVPDVKLVAVLARLAFKNTDSLIGAVADALGREGITLLPSTVLLGDQLARPGTMTRRSPSKEEREDVAYGEKLARTLASLDVGQTVVVKQRAAVAVEAMEGTDDAIRRAGRLAGAGAVVVKVAKPRQDLRFDVPVVGPGTLEAMREAGARALAVDAEKTLLVDKEAFLADADKAGITVLGMVGPASAGAR